MSQQWKTEGEDDVQMPLGTGESAVGEESYGEGRPKVNTSTVALFAAFAAALAVLYLLGLQNKPRAASAEDQARQAQITASIESVLSRSTTSRPGATSLLSDTDRLVQLIRNALVQHAGQVEISENPFERDVVRPVFSNSPLTQAMPVSGDAGKIRRLAEEFQKLKLQMVMLGPRPAAMVNDRMVTVGAKLGSFTISDIQQNKVLLTADEGTYELKGKQLNSEDPQ
jgi:hypothetical protein